MWVWAWGKVGWLVCVQGDWSESEVVWLYVVGGGVIYLWFGANMGGRCNKNTCKIVLQVLKLSQKLLGI